MPPSDPFGVARGTEFPLPEPQIADADAPAVGGVSECHPTQSNAPTCPGLNLPAAPEAGNALGVPLTWILPGHGEARDSCGRKVKWGHQVAGGGWHWWSRVKSCVRRACPSCYQDWAAREAGKAEDRVMLGLGAHLQRVVPGKAIAPQCGCVRHPKPIDGPWPPGYVTLGPECVWSAKSGRVTHYRWTRGRRLAVHVVVAPPAALWKMADDLSGFRTLRDLAYEQAEAAGVDGGVWVFHYYRLGDRWDNERGGQCVAGPHWHVVGDAWTEPLTTEDIAAGKWVVWNLGVRESVRGTLIYLLSHAPRAVGTTDLYRSIRAARADPAAGTSPSNDLSSPVQTVTWAGRWSYGAMRHPKPTEEGEPVLLCPVGKHMIARRDCFELANEGTGPPDGEMGSSAAETFRAVRPVGFVFGVAPDLPTNGAPDY